MLIKVLPMSITIDVFSLQTSEGLIGLPINFHFVANFAG